MGLLARYMSGLCVAALGLCAAGWLVLTPVAFGYRGSGPHEAALADRATGGGLAVVSLLTLLCWTLAWRHKLRADGALPRLSRRQARREARDLRRRQPDGGSDPASGIPDPAQVLSELRALLLPLLAESPGEAAAPAEPVLAEAPGEPDPGTELHRHPGIPEPRSEQESFGIGEGWPSAFDEPRHHQAAEPDRYQPAPVAAPRPVTEPAPAPAPPGIAAIESMLAGAELLVVGGNEEEAW